MDPMSEALLNPVTTPSDEVVKQFDANPSAGLSSPEVGTRLEKYGPNELIGKPPVPAWRRFLRQFQSPLIYLLIAATIVSTIAWVLQPAGPGKELVPVDAIVIAVIVLFNAMLGYVQENRAADAVATLQSMTQARSTVLRDGQQSQVNSSELVPGDILLLAEGDEVGADARLVSASSLLVAESSLTGESVPVEKENTVLQGVIPLGDRVNMVYKGTAVTQGVGQAVVVATGMATEMGNIATMLSQAEDEPTPLSKELDSLGRMLGIGVIGIAVIVMSVNYLTSTDHSVANLIAILILGVSLAVAAVPEGLPAILTVVLSLGTQRMANRNAIVKDLSSVETLGSASVIASDKTGTLTRNEMTVQRVVTASGQVEVTGIGYAPDGEVLHDGRPLEGDVATEARLVLSGGYLANDARLEQVDGQWQVQGDPTEASFLVAAHKLAGTVDYVRGFDRSGQVPFTSARKMMSVTGTMPVLGSVLWSKGAPDVLLGNCTSVRVGDTIEPLTDDRREHILAEINDLAEQAFRTLGVAYRLLETDPGEDVDASHETGLVYVGTVAMIDPPRTEAKAAIAEARRAGIRVLMITGDHPATAARIATDLGIVEPGAKALTGAQIDELTDEQFNQAVKDHSVFARVAPEHKMRIINALQNQGEIVSMTGDGVNDAPALKSADIGVAMGITGTEVSKEAANMVLADDNFATIVAAVREGRNIFENIRKFLRYLLSTNMGEVMTVFFGTMFAAQLGLHELDGSPAVPLLATQILWINLVTDSGPALAMGVDPAIDDVMSNKPRRKSEKVISRGMWFQILWVGSVMAAVMLFVLDWFEPGGLFEGSFDIAVARTAAFTCLVFAQLFNALSARSATSTAFRGLFSNKWLWGAILLAVLLQVAVVEAPVLQSAFKTAPLTLEQWGFCIAASSIVLWAEEIRKLIVRGLGVKESGQGVG